MDVCEIHTYTFENDKGTKVILEHKQTNKKVPALVLEFSQWLVYVCPYVQCIKSIIANMSVKPHMMIL